MDKVIVRLLATLQILISGLCFLMVIFALNYGGAQKNPTALPLAFLYCGYGMISGLLLFSLHLYTRIFAVVWHAIFVIVTILAMNHANSRQSLGGLLTSIFVLSFFSLFYLALTSVNLAKKQSESQKASS
jgi:hypothetical protein